QVAGRGAVWIDDVHLHAEAGRAPQAAARSVVTGFSLVRDLANRGVVEPARTREVQAHGWNARWRRGVRIGLGRVAARTAVEGALGHGLAGVDGRSHGSRRVPRTDTRTEAETKRHRGLLERRVVDGPKPLTRLRVGENLDRVERVRHEPARRSIHRDPFDQVVLDLE